MICMSVLLFTCRGPGFDVASAMHHRVLSLSFFWGPEAIPDKEGKKPQNKHVSNTDSATLLVHFSVERNKFYT